jgi:hypothetical protein
LNQKHVSTIHQRKPPKVELLRQQAQLVAAGRTRIRQQALFGLLVSLLVGVGVEPVDINKGGAIV